MVASFFKWNIRSNFNVEEIRPFLKYAWAKYTKHIQFEYSAPIPWGEDLKFARRAILREGKSWWGKHFPGQVFYSCIIYKHPSVVAETRLDGLPYLIFHCTFTRLVRHLKHKFWHSMHIFTKVGGCSTGEPECREFPISFPLPKPHCVGLPCWKAEVMLGLFICLKPEGMWHQGNDISQQPWWWIWEQLFQVRDEWGPSETEMHIKLFQSCAEYSKLSRMCILVNLTIIPGNTVTDSTS